MSRFAHFRPEDFEGALDRLIDRADHARKEARENGPAPDELLGVIKDIAAAGAQTDSTHLAVQDGRPSIEDDDFPLNAFDERCIALERKTRGIEESPHPCPVTGKGECKVKLCREGCFLRDQLGYGERQS